MDTSAASVAPVPPSQNVVRRHALVFYFLLAYGFTGGYALVFYVLLHINLNLLVLGPPLAAIIMTAAIEGAAGVRRLLGRIVLWRVGVQWYLFAIPGIFVISLLGTIVLPGALASYHAPSTGFLLNIPLIFVVSFLIGPLFEEVGWRGFALPRMQRLQGPLIGSLLLGLLWACWHLPLFLVPDFASQNGGLSLASFSMLALGAIAISIIMTWVFNNTRGSLLIIMLIHNSVNVSQGVVSGLFPGVNSNLNILIGFGVTALVIVLVTRGRLGYQTERSVGTGG
jgi:membrane protease YdiL (CAAX protease family)